MTTVIDRKQLMAIGWKKLIHNYPGIELKFCKFEVHNLLWSNFFSN